MLSSSAKFDTKNGSTLTQNGLTWTVTTKKGEIQNSYNNDTYKGQQFGTSKNPWQGTFSTENVQGTVTKVSVAANTGGNATLSVKVGNVDFKCGGKTSASVVKKSQGINTYDFEGGASGKIVVSLNGTSKACYLGSITVTYVGSDMKLTELSFPKDSYSFATTNDLSAFTGQKATLTSGGAELTGKTVTYSKLGEDIFSTFDDKTGVLALNGKAGVATVTAKFAGDDVYASSTKSYTVTVKKVYTDIASLKKDITSKSKSNPDKFTVDFKDAIVTYKSGDNLFIQDATGGLYSSASNTDLNGNDKINGWVDISVYKDQGQTRVNRLTFYKDTKIAPDAEFTPEVVTLTQLNDNMDAYENMRVRVVGVTLTSLFYRKEAKISQDGTTITLYDKSSNTSWDEKVGDVLDIEGYPCTYNGTKELCVWRKMDVDSPVVLDEISDNISDVIKANADKVVTVTLKRSISKDYLNTVCLPFDLSAEKIAEVFGEGSVVSDYTSVTGTVMNFTPVTEMVANHPYIVNATETFDTKNIAGVTLKTIVNDENRVDRMNAEETFIADFVGSPSIYTFTSVAGDQLFLGKDGKLYRPNAEGKLKGMRAYFEVLGGTGNGAKVNIGGGLSSIDKLMNGEAMTGKVYNLNGQYVGNTLDGLAKGLYIMNGKKYVVK
ncbi:hypothetical protein [uncultured Prevotella sp.]|uniref:hypothetical protein n=1 Tax=uncultured Prevotella sp. TaxID=159272 RepID=UPI00260D0BB8|nr:hypothetical protein [uncultured Prevotella sp.]